MKRKETRISFQHSTWCNHCNLTSRYWLKCLLCEHRKSELPDSHMVIFKLLLLKLIFRWEDGCILLCSTVMPSILIVVIGYWHRYELNSIVMWLQGYSKRVLWLPSRPVNYNPVTSTFLIFDLLLLIFEWSHVMSCFRKWGKFLKVYAPDRVLCWIQSLCKTLYSSLKKRGANEWFLDSCMQVCAYMWEICVFIDR